MEKLKNNSKVSIHAYKFNGWLYRTWEFATILEQTDEYVCVSSQGARILTNRIDSDNHYHSRVLEPSIWYFFKNQWFNLIYQRRNNCIKVYINLASPFIYEDEAIKYIDFDIDFVNKNFEKNHALKKIDLNEFTINSNRLNYPNILKKKIIETANEIETRFKNGELDKYFNKQLLQDSGVKYDNKKRLLRTKTGWDQRSNRPKGI